MIHVEDLRYSYPGKSELVLKGISFSIEKGEIFGFLGPSGAGKSTTQKTLIGILKDYKGKVKVAGKNISEVTGEFYNKIGVSFELPNLYSKLTGKENLDFFASLYKSQTTPSMELLNMLGLEDAADKKVSDYSKGMKMRLNFCRALVHDPDIVFLDEPTAGLDPVNAKKVKDIILKLKSRGKTIFLTTHNMAVADELCDRVAFINEGVLALIDSPRQLKLEKGEKKLRLDYSEDGQIVSREFSLKGLGENVDFLNLLKNKEIETIHSKEATLEEIFIQTTGRGLS
ncbi:MULTISPECIES: ABC transporter ATP-binding protein [unclassified Oceanispirochaeta]|uniref:ABC transporter ATP-binding protein n=1 Tax=unclassified Oceanispirochaeta TaxID=2635722 RepID=UPI000E095853|nr:MULTISPECIES: ABC transporter ATP-binding protein [unclassified Oceanispirochaeta]MBF9016295.1 ABC transporter ATP-binding protein [Oceanispirochaeta sp. M2]NPD72758.1 ABC transporter ATP-binding protein [Oceanispirochaeta sp. M1]RDG31604.1 ABC transporter ATP-binding protein [Oceanispirochaeta sp. M1]